MALKPIKFDLKNYFKIKLQFCFKLDLKAQNNTF